MYNRVGSRRNHSFQCTTVNISHDWKILPYLMISDCVLITPSHNVYVCVYSEQKGRTISQSTKSARVLQLLKDAAARAAAIQAAIDKAAHDKAAAIQAAIDKAAYDKAAAVLAAIKKEADDKASAKRAAGLQAAALKAAAKLEAAEKARAHQAAVEQAAADRAAAKLAAAEKIIADQIAAEQAAADQAEVDQAVLIATAAHNIEVFKMLLPSPLITMLHYAQLILIFCDV